MQLTRRNAVIGLGALAGGGGLVAATGAFDAVEADRSFDVGVADDAAALLAISDLNEAIAEYVESGTGGNEVIAFTLDDEQINEDAVTEFFEAFTVTNNGSQDVELTTTTDDGNGDSVDGLSFTGTENGDELVDGVNVLVNESISVDITLNTRDATEDPDGGYTEPSGDPYQVTLRAASNAAQQ